MSTISRKFLLIAIVAILLSAFPLNIATADDSMDFDVANGHFFKQANGKGGAGDTGFAVTDEGGIAFWTSFQQYGGVDKVGYPVSNRFTWKNFTVQAFQKVVFQWHPESSSVALVNVFDELADANKDDWLLSVRSVPKAADWSSDQGKSWDEIVQNHYALLDANAAIKAAYFDESDPVTMNGLPMAAQDFGSVYVVRAQRKVFQQWKDATPWAAAGEVTVANGGDLGKEAGIYPVSATTPAAPGAVAAAPSAPPVDVGAPIAISDREAMAGLANKAWPIWAIVVTVDEYVGKGVTAAKGDFNKMTGPIDQGVKAVEPLVGEANALVAPPNVPYAQALVDQLKKGVPLYYEGLKQLNWAITTKNGDAFDSAIKDLNTSYEALRQAFWEFKAGVEKQGLRYENGKWQ